MDRAFLWVAWNLFLAVLPVLFARRLATQLTRARGGKPHLWPAVALWLALWLAFLPNTCYLLTEWRHWFDLMHGEQYWVRWAKHGSLSDFMALAQWTLFFASFSGAGVIAFWAAIRPLGQALSDCRWRPWLGALLFWLNGLGVYLGLELRFNSWQVVSQPAAIARQALTALSHPVFIVLVSGFALLLWALYEIVETFAAGIRYRLAARKGSDPA
ncbi:MAG: DUF1361 domain-containing protein [Armatimonadetes bacterium]|nr:DUF1361 domain-containing protein [Armatimonadota bacterium]